MNDFNYIYTVANSLYGLELEPEQFEELGLTAWNLIGNKTVRLYNYSADISNDDFSVQLPCNCDIIEAVTYNHEDWNYSTNKTVNGDYNSQFTEQYIEARKLYQSPFYITGKYAKYERVGDTLYFDKDYGKVNILYKGVILDEDGLPQVNEKEALAIATYIAFATKQKQGWITNNQNIIQLAQYLYQQWLKYCDSARVPLSIDQNTMNQVLDAKSSWNRKVYNKAYKPIY
mgnify:FL=1